jgi:fumarate reductase subunit D
MAKSNEPFWWAMFGAGGMVAALFVPITMIVTGFLVPLDVINRDDLYRLFQSPWVRLYLVVIISLPLFHWAHRFRFTLVDLGLKAAHTAIAVACYGLAVVGTIVAVLLALRIWP